MAVAIVRWQFTVEDYARMRETGILSEDDRVELLDGEIRAMRPIGPFHAAVVKRLNALLSHQLADRAIVSVQDPVQLTDYSEPQPDLAVLRPRDDFYARAHPRPADVLLVVEVADTSAEYDRTEKIPRYAQGLIPEAWLVDINHGTITQYTQPDGIRYQQEQRLTRGQVVISQAVPMLRVVVTNLLASIQ